MAFLARNVQFESTHEDTSDPKSTFYFLKFIIIKEVVYVFKNKVNVKKDKERL